MKMKTIDTILLSIQLFFSCLVGGVLLQVGLTNMFSHEIDSLIAFSGAILCISSANLAVHELWSCKK